MGGHSIIIINEQFEIIGMGVTERQGGFQAAGRVSF